MTHGGVEHDLEQSRFVVELDGIKFYFSSELHRRKFKLKFAINRMKISESLQDRFNFYITAYNLADVVLYAKVETRGFLIEFEGEKIWEKTLRLDTVIQTKKALKERLTISMQNAGG